MGRKPTRIILTPPRKIKLFEVPPKTLGSGGQYYVIVSQYLALNSSDPEIYRNPPPPTLPIL